MGLILFRTVIVQLDFVYHGKNLVFSKPFQVQSSGSAGGHAQSATLAKDRIDLRLSGETSFLYKRRRRIGTHIDADTATAA